MLLKPETEKIQTDFATYCRTGHLHSQIDGVKEDRLYHYRRLVYNGVNDTLKRAFPIAYKVLGDEWEVLVNTFFVNHNCATPQLWKLPGEFFEYFEANTPDCIAAYPFLIELLYFEWIEIEVHTMPDEEIPEVREGSWSSDNIVFNREHKIINLSYPVHLYKPEEVEQHKGQYFLLIYRERETGNVRFIDISPLHAYVLINLQEGEKLPTILKEAAEIYNIADGSALYSHIIHFLEDLKRQDFVLGFN